MRTVEMILREHKAREEARIAKEQTALLDAIKPAMERNRRARLDREVAEAVQVRADRLVQVCEAMRIMQDEKLRRCVRYG